VKPEKQIKKNLRTEATNIKGIAAIKIPPSMTTGR